MEPRKRLILLFLSYLCWVEGREIVNGCKKAIITEPKARSEYLPIERKLHAPNMPLKFYAMSTSEAHVLLSPTDTATDDGPIYDLKISSKLNSHTDTKIYDEYNVSEPTERIILDNEWHEYWIKFSDNGTIQVGKEGDALPITDWYDPEAPDIKYLSFSTKGDYPGAWAYDCDNEKEPKEFVEGCKSTTVTQNKDYNKFFPIQRKNNSSNFRLEFYVMSPSDANVLLSPFANASATDSVYEIVIGSHQNSRTLIRQRVNGSDMVFASTPRLLSNKEWRGFWIQLSDEGLIQVGKIGDIFPFAFWQSPETLDVKYFSFSSHYQQMGLWAFDCEDDKEPIKGCKSTTSTQNKAYNKFFPIERKVNSSDVRLEFYVMSSSDANVVLSPFATASATDSVYEIVIGSHQNSRTLIRQRVNGEEMVSASTPGLLSNKEWRGFWIQLSDEGLIQVGKIGDIFPFAFWQSPETLDVKYFSFSSHYQQMGLWAFECEDEKKPLQLSFKGCKSTALTQSKGYKEFIPIERKDNSSDILLKFYVRARSDAHVLLSPIVNASDSDAVYEIQIGSFTNSRTDIRRKINGEEKISVETEEIISNQEWRKFWIKYSKKGTLQFGKDGDVLPIAVWHDPEPLDIKYFSFSSGGDYKGAWAYECDDEKGLLSTFMYFWIEPEELVKGCKSTTATQIKAYNEFFPIERKVNSSDIRLDFYVMSSSDANVLLSPYANASTNDSVYEIVIGSHYNSRTIIRQRVNYEEVVSVFTPELLSDKEWHGFWVQLNNKGLIQVGKIGDIIPFAFWQSPETLDVKYFSFSSHYKAGLWAFDCEDDKEPIQPSVKGCKNTTLTQSKAYNQFLPIGRNDNSTDILLQFYVMGTSDAHVLLSPIVNASDSDAVYEIQIGSHTNSRTDIRRKINGEEKISVETEKIISNQEWRRFWIKYSKKGTLQVGKDGDVLPIIVWHDPEPLDIKYFSFSSLDFSGVWAYDCDDEKEPKPLSVKGCNSTTVTHSKAYDQFLPIARNDNSTDILLKFHVIATSNAHVILSPIINASGSDSVYEIQIGSHTNSRTEIRRKINGEEKISVETEEIISNQEWRRFWIRYSKKGTLQFGKDGDVLPIAVWHDPAPLDIKYFRFSSGEDYTGAWAYDCDDEKEPEELVKGCKSTTATQIKAYNEFFPIERKVNSSDIRLDFYVMSSSDANVLLSPYANASTNDSVYEIVIGSHSNSRTLIRQRVNYEEVVSVFTPELLSDKEWHGFWVQLNNKGLIQVGKIGDIFPFAFWQSPETLDVKYFSFSSHYKAGLWAFDCEDDKEPIQPSVKGCKNTTLTQSKAYNQFLPIGRNDNSTDILLQFYVMGTSDAHVLLSPIVNASDSDAVYEIQIGSHTNSRTDIRRKINGEEKISVETEEIISNQEWRRFWIKYSKKGTLQVGKDGDVLPIIVWHDPEPLDIKYFSFSSLDFSGVWAYDCDDEKEPKPLSVKGCNSTTVTHSKAYDQFLPIARNDNSTDILLKFHVMGTSDAHVLLSPIINASGSDSVYEIQIGSHTNSRTEIRRKINGEEKISVKTKGIISNKEWRRFWIRYSKKGTLQFGKDGDVLPIVVWHDPEPLDIKYFSLSSGSDYTGAWAYDCDDEKEPDPLSVKGCKSTTVTHSKAYDQFLPIARNDNSTDILLKFHVIATSDAHVILSPIINASGSDSVYKIQIGSYRNSRIDVLRNFDGDKKVSVRIAGIISNKEWRRFWIKYSKKGTLQVGKDGDVLPIAVWHDPAPLDIKYFRFSSGGDYTGAWAYDCDDEKEPEELVKGCKSTTATQNKVYNEFFPIERKVNSSDIRLDFYVMSSSDANVLLSPYANASTNDSVYEIVIGSHSNSRTLIRQRVNYEEVVSVFTPELLSDKEWHGFWVQLNNKGLIQVGKIGDIFPFAFWQSPETLDVKYISFSSHYKAGLWAFDCEDDKEPKPLSVKGCNSTTVTHSKAYDQFLPIARNDNSTDILLQFYVMGTSDAHVLLSPIVNASDSDAVYEIQIGSHTNSRTDIRRNVNGEKKISVETEEIISNKEWRRFWIKYSKKGTLQVGKDGDVLPIIVWHDPEPLDIKYFSFSSLDFSGVWAYDCDDEKEPKPLSVKGCNSTTVTHSKAYNPFLPIARNDNSTDILLKFHVIATSDAHVILSPIINASGSDSVYKIQIGSYRNSRIDVLRNFDGDKKVSVRIAGIISNKEWRRFWIKYSKKGTLQVGKDGDVLPIAVWHDPAPLDIKYFRFASGGDYTGAWAYDCDDEKEPEELVKGCKSTTATQNKAYNKFFPIERKVNSSDVRLEFYVMSSSDANVVLSPFANASATDSVYEIVIGSHQNSRILIRQRVNGEEMVSASTPGLLSNKEWRGFWVKLGYKGQILQVGRIGDAIPVAIWRFPKFLEVNYFSFSSHYGEVGLWAFDCEDEKRGEDLANAPKCNQNPE